MKVIEIYKKALTANHPDIKISIKLAEKNI